MYDVIGDIHGHADELVELLETLGYKESGDCFRHPHRRAAFCGDFVDRGPQIADVLNVARTMVEGESAVAVMGNHEFNAIAFHTPRTDAAGEFCRPHTEKNVRQHQATLDQIAPVELADWVNWFRSLPVALDLGPLRVVHACWDPGGIGVINRSLSGDQPFDASFMAHATTVGEPIFDTIETVLKGPEMKLPDGVTVTDKEGTLRRRIRIRWFEKPGGRTLAEYALPREPALPRVAVPDTAPAVPYPRDAPPVFVGHYWLPARKPAPLASNIACLDYSVAKGGMLCAYRFDGEQRLTAEHFVTVQSRDSRREQNRRNRSS